MSTPGQEEGASVPEQLRGIRAYAREQGLEIVREFSEAASAFKSEPRRVEFRRMLATVLADPELQVVLVHDYSRLSRQSVQGAQPIRELHDAGVEVVSVSDPPMDRETPAGVFMEAITFAKNEAYSREISFHTRKGCRANVQTRDPETGWCYKNGGGPPWGYRAVTVQRGIWGGRPLLRRLRELDSEVIHGTPVHEWVRYCLVELAGEGATIGELCEFCVRNALPRRRGGPWRRSIWRHLLGPVSLLRHAGYEAWDTAVPGRPWVLRPPEDWLVVAGAHPALVTLEEARAVAIATRAPRLRGLYRGLTRRESAPFLISGGVFRCSKCGSAMVSYKRGGYLCSAQAEAHTEVCQRTCYISRSKVESRVVKGLEAVLEMLTGSDLTVDSTNHELVHAFASPVTRGRVGVRARTPTPDGSVLLGSLVEAPQLPVEEELAKLQEETPPVSESAEAIQKLLQKGIVPAQVWPTLSPEERRHLVVSLLQDPLEVEVGEEDGRLRLFAGTCLYAQTWEAWETADATRPAKGDSGGRIASAVRARD